MSNIQRMIIDPNNVSCLTHNIKLSPKLLVLDYDHTIVIPKDGHRFPKNKDDWQWLRPNVPDIIKEYYENDYKIYIVTNQSKEWKLDMIADSLMRLGILIEVIVGFGNIRKNPDIIRKPNPLLFTDSHGKKIKFDEEHSLFVGDAADKELHFSDSDKVFAENIGMKFKTPEQIFPINMSHGRGERITTQDYHVDHQEIVILVGFPACGKSTFANEKLVPYSYNIVSGDELKTLSKQCKATEVFLKKGESVVIDATNPTVEKRAVFIELAEKYNVAVRCIVFDVSINDAMTWNKQRFLKTGKKVPDIAFYMFRKNYIKPTMAECIVMIL